MAQQNMNSVPYGVSGLTPGRFSIFGSTVDDPTLVPYLQSPQVDVQREYHYPAAYAYMKMAMTVATAGAVLNYALPVVDPMMNGFLALMTIVLWVAICCVHCCYYHNNQASDQQPLSGREFRHVVGSSAISVGTIGYFLAGLAFNAIKDIVETHVYWYHNMLLYFWAVSSAIALVVPTWFLLNKLTKLPITFSFVMSMFWGGATFGLLCSSIFNSILLMYVWPRAFPACHIGFIVGIGPLPPYTSGCLTTQWFQWVFTPGLVEEGLKFAVLLRIRTNLQEIASSCWLTRCLRSSDTPLPCCAWMLKLATSPSAIVIAGIAAGGGFASFENFQYLNMIMKAPGNEENPWAPSIRVKSAFLHMFMTGNIAIFFATEKFLAPNSFYMRFVAFAAMMCLHGTFNCFALFGTFGKLGNEACKKCDAEKCVETQQGLCNALGGYHGWEDAESYPAMILFVVFAVLMSVFLCVIEPRWQRSITSSAPGQTQEVEMQS